MVNNNVNRLRDLYQTNIHVVEIKNGNKGT